jgi:protein-disulfide isomerase
MMTTSGTQLTPPVSARDHVIGPALAPVTLVEYGDFECPYCAAAHPVVIELRHRLGNVLLFAFRHFPLTRIHPHAQRAAEAAQAAGAQGKFWQMHDLLYENQAALEDQDLILYAVALGLDVGRFQSELIGGLHLPRVREDFLSGVRSGVNGTPTFFINGVRHDGSHDLASLESAVRAALPVPKLSSR